MADTQVLMRLGPFKGMDTRTGSPYLQSGDGLMLSNVDTHRMEGELCNFFGRSEVVGFPMLGPGKNLQQVARYETAPDRLFIIGQAADGTTAYYDVKNEFISTFGAVSEPFTMAVQSNGNLFLNNGQQVFLGTDDRLHAALWNYPQPTQAKFNYSAVGVAQVGAQLAPATYSYAFVQVITIPTKVADIQQETTPLGNTEPFAYSVTTDGTQVVELNGTFAGTTDDGYQFVTQVFRYSQVSVSSTTTSAVPVWYLLATLDTNGVYVDNTPDPIVGAQEIIPFQDPPPTGGTYGLNPIESQFDRMWVLARIQDSDTNNQAQTQLWFSELGQPWSFDRLNNVNLVGDANTTMETSDSGFYGDNPRALAALGSYVSVLKSKTQWIETGVDQATFQPLPFLNDNGAVSMLSVAKINGLLFWHSTQFGPFMFDGTSPTFIGMKIWTALQAIPPSQQQNCVGFGGDLKYFLSFPDANVTFVYYIPTQDWTTLPYATTSAAVASQATSAVDGTGFKFGQILAVRQNSQYVDAWLNGKENDLGAGTPVSFTTAPTNCGISHAQKNFEYVMLEAPPQSEVSVDIVFTVTGCDPVPWTFDLDPESGWTGVDYLRIEENTAIGYLAQLEVSFVTPIGATSPVEIWALEVGGSPQRPWIINDNG
jgi:hypothetical protein